MAVSSHERHNKLCAAWYNFLVQRSGYRLIRISDLEHADVVNILSLRQRPWWSRIELNDGSWEFCIPLVYIDELEELVQKYSNAKIYSEYNPLIIPKHDIKYFGFPAAHGMNGFWLEERAKQIHGTPRHLYVCLVDIQKLISEQLSRHLVR